MTHEPDVSTSDIVNDVASDIVDDVPDEHEPTHADTPALGALETVNTSTGDLAAIRELVLRAHPEVVRELVTGATVDDLLASIEPAEAAYRRVSESVRATTTPSPPATTVPAGGDRPMPIDPDRLPASEKIRRGLANR